MRRLRFKMQDDRGAIAIEAVISMFFFTIAVLSIMFMSLMVRAQSMVQYAISQAAKEISGYYYIVDKMGLAKFTSGNSAADVSEANEFLGQADSIIKNAVSFSDSEENSTNIELHLDRVDADSVKQAAISLKNMNIKDQLTGTLSIVARSLIQQGVSKLVAPLVCKTVVPKYMGGSREAADARLRAMGIDGIDSIDFSWSSFLRDGRTIQVVAIYEMDLSKLSLGMVDGTIKFKQVATTAAWVKPDGKNIISVDKTLEVKELND